MSFAMKGDDCSVNNHGVILPHAALTFIDTPHLLPYNQK
jgi:hypothetical protein